MKARSSTRALRSSPVLNKNWDTCYINSSESAISRDIGGPVVTDDVKEAVEKTIRSEQRGGTCKCSGGGDWTTSAHAPYDGSSDDCIITLFTSQ